MKNAVFYRESWLMPNSKAREFWEAWKKSGDNKDRKKLDDHMKSVERIYDAMVA